METFWLTSKLSEIAQEYFNVQIDGKLLFSDIVSGEYKEVTEQSVLHVALSSHLQSYNSNTSLEALDMYLFQSTVEHILK
jgi:hypothetical protein